MAKDNEENSEVGQDEYQYTDPDSTETYVEPEQPAAPPPPVASVMDDRRKRIIIILVILGVIFIVFQFVKAKNKTNKTTEVTPVSGIEKQMDAEPQAVQQPASVTPPAVQTGGDATKLPLPETSALSATPPEDTTHKVADQSEQNSEQIQKLQTSVEQLQTSVSQLTEAVSVLQTKVQGAAKKRERTVSVQKKISRPHREKGYKMGMHGKPNVYYIKAVVPRRAWLQASNGNAVTVKEGDNIPGYGTVQSIDANDGTVVTSSNKIIRFSSDDN